jgi:chaperonin GroES
MTKKGQNVAKDKKKIVKKAVAKKATAKKTTVKKTATKKSLVKKAAVKKAAPKKPAAKAVAKPKPKAKAKAKAKPKVMQKKATAIKATPSKALVTKAAKTVDLRDFLTPLDDRVIIQPAGAEKMTAGGLYIPETATDVPGNIQGTVVSVGRGHRNKKGQVRPMDLKVGDKVLFADYTGSKINVQNHDLVIVREGDVLGVVG